MLLEDFMFEVKKILVRKLHSFCVVMAMVVFIVSCQAKSDLTISNNDSIKILNDVSTVNVNNSSQVNDSPQIKVDSKVKFSSVYTKLDAKSCQPISKSKNEDEEIPDICRGYQGYKVFVSHHGVVTKIYIGREIGKDVENWDASTLPSFVANNAGNGQIIEWRLANGKPFACIVRAQYDKQLINPDENGMLNELVVKNLKGFAKIDETIDAAKNSRANIEARNRADRAYLASLK